VQGDFTIRLYKNGVLSAVVVTLTEIASGDYKISFTTDSSENVSWDLLVFQTAAADIQYVRTFRVTSDLASEIAEIKSIIINFITGATRMSTGVSERVGGYYRVPEVIPKHQEAEAFYDFNFDYFLQIGETIESAEVTITQKSTGEDVTDVIGAEVEPEIAGANVDVWLAEGTPGEEYIVEVLIETSEAQKFVQLARLQVGATPKPYLE